MEPGLHTENLGNPITPETERALGTLAVLASETASKQEVERVFLPRDYQEECLEVLAEEREKGSDRALVVMASGLGKTLLAAFDVKRYLEKSGGRVLYLCHQNYILEQARERFEAVLGEQYTYGYFHGSASKDFHEVNCLFASFQSMSSWHEAFLENEFDYIVVDESHHGQAPTYRPVLEHFKPEFMLAVTATPDRADLKDIRQIYGPEVFSLPIEQAWARGLLTSVDYRLITDELVETGSIKTNLGKLSMKELNRRLFAPKRDEEIARIIQERSAGVDNPRTIIFCPSIEYCEYLSVLLPRAVPIHSSMHRELQDRRLRLFRSGEVKTILTVDKFNEGIDIEETNVVVFLRSTASHTLFLQQLGRGLRKFEGKDKVLVLDFVANCERLSMIQNLWKKVQEERTKYQESHKDDGEVSFSVDIGEVEFNEVAQDVLDIMAEIRGGYTREILIKQLHDLAEKLGKVPTTIDLREARKRGECAPLTRFREYFGLWEKALEAAGFDTYKKSEEEEKEEIANQLKMLANELNKIPTEDDAKLAYKAENILQYSVSVIRRRFGRYSSALSAAGLNVSVRRIWGKEEMISQLQELAKTLGRTPTSSDIELASKSGQMPTPQTFAKKFGSLPDAIVEAGFIPYMQSYTREELVTFLRSITENLGRVPNQRDIHNYRKAGKSPSLAVYIREFGSLNKALRAGNIGSAKTHYTEEDLIKQLQELGERLGRTPSYRDVKENFELGSIASAPTFNSRFGGFTKALKAAGFDVESKAPYTKELVIKQLQDLAQELGRVLTQADINEASKVKKCAAPRTLIRLFGSQAKAIEAAGLEASKGYYSEEELLSYLINLGDKLGKIPSYKDVLQASGSTFPHPATFNSRFGGFTKALKAAGFDVESKAPYTKELVIKQLQDLAQELGRVPSVSDIEKASKAKKCPSYNTIVNLFGSRVRAFEASGFSHTPRDPYTKEQVIEQIQQLARELGRTPKASDINDASKAKKCASYTTIVKLFGSRAKAFELASL